MDRSRAAHHLLSRPSRVVLYLVAALPALTPLFSAYPPFQDWAAHAGLISLVHHYDDAAIGLQSHFISRGFGGLNALFYWLGGALAFFVGPKVAAQILLGISLGSLAPAMGRLCAAAGTDERWALAALPLAFGRHVYCGFIPNALALAIALMVLAAYFRLRDTPTPLRAAIFTAWIALLAGMHAFVFLVFAGLVALALLWDVRAHRQATALASAGVFGSAALFALLMSRGVGYIGGSVSARDCVGGDLGRHPKTEYLQGDVLRVALCIS